MATFNIREEGKNGTVEILHDRIIRTRKKHIGKDDVQTIPINSISGVHHDRKTLGTDQVKLNVGPVTYEWKVSNAEAMVAALHERMFATGSPAEVAPPVAPGSAVSVADELAKLASLRDAGALTPDEFEAQKERLLGR